MYIVYLYVEICTYVYAYNIENVSNIKLYSYVNFVSTYM